MWGGWGIYSLNHHEVAVGRLQSHGAPDSPVRHRTLSGAPATSVDRWGSTVGVLSCGPAWLSGGAPDRPCRLSGVPPTHALLLCAPTLEHYQTSFPSTPTLRGPRVSERGKIAPVANYCCPKSYIYCAPGPTCRGSALLYMPPLSYKRGSMQRYKKGLRPKSSKTRLDSLRLTHNSSSQAIQHTVE
jgi:hypothetical protein